MRSLGWKELVVGETVIIRDSDPLSAKIEEIDENLARNDLNALDRAIFFAERKNLYDQRRGETRGRKRKDVEFKEKEKRPNFGLLISPRFTEDAAKRTGWSHSTVKAACALALALDPQAIAAIRGTMLEDNQVELLALSKLETEQQRAVAGFIKAGTARNVLQAKWAAGIEKEPNHDPQANILRLLLENFEKASKPTRAQFMKLASLDWRKKEEA
jgi:ParB family chromosome partitioning protein